MSPSNKRGFHFETDWHSILRGFLSEKERVRLFRWVSISRRGKGSDAPAGEERGAATPRKGLEALQDGEKGQRRRGQGGAGGPTLRLQYGAAVAAHHLLQEERRGW